MKSFSKSLSGDKEPNEKVGEHTWFFSKPFSGDAKIGDKQGDFTRSFSKYLSGELDAEENVGDALPRFQFNTIDEPKPWITLVASLSGDVEARDREGDFTFLYQGSETLAGDGSTVVVRSGDEDTNDIILLRAGIWT
jgi:hypothetical protein